MNDKLFRPHGLYCLIMTYKPQQKADHERVDISRAIAKSITPADSKFRQQLKGLKNSSGKTYGELEMPDSAPLIFPALDAVATAANQDGKEPSKLKTSSKFVADYLDRRAQASYVRLQHLVSTRRVERELIYNRPKKTQPPRSQPHPLKIASHLATATPITQLQTGLSCH